MRFWIILCGLLFIYPPVGFAESAKPLVEEYATGRINWTQGVLTAKGEYLSDSPVDENTPIQDNDTLCQAKRLATQNALQTLKLLRIDAVLYVVNVMATKALVGQKVVEMADNAQIVEKTLADNGSIQVTVQMPLMGGLMQLLLPEEIKQVEPIKPVHTLIQGEKAVTFDSAQGAEATVDGAYTGLVIDARGIGAKPAMVPLVVDETGKEVYGSAFVSREYAVQYGLCKYVRTMADVHEQVRIGQRPLPVKGLRTLHDRNCDIVISNADAAKLRESSINLEFLKQCRVAIILD